MVTDRLGGLMDTCGIVLGTSDHQRAVFLDAREIGTLHQTIEVVVQRPTVAGGTLDIGSLGRLGRALELTNVADPANPTGVQPIVLSNSEQAALELLRGQAAVRDDLPERIHLVCHTCGLERIINPAVAAAEQAARRAREGTTRAADQLSTLITAGVMLGAGSPLGIFTALSAINKGGSQTSATPQLTCTRCQGTSFEATPLTYCPGCREPRDEAVLLTCPDCQFDFRSRTPATPIWTSPADAADCYWVTTARAIFLARTTDFENGLYPGQRDALCNALTGDDRVVALVRSRFPGQTLRTVAVLLTSHALLWARQSLTSKMTNGRIDWSTVARLRPAGLLETDASERSFEIVTTTGSVTQFLDFRGAGLSLNEQTHTFDLDGVYRLVAELVSARQPQAVIEPLTESPAPALVPLPALAAPPETTPPPPPATAPAPPPAMRTPASLPPPHHVLGVPPNWYPDPWRQARFRWWDGTRWTPFVR